MHHLTSFYLLLAGLSGLFGSVRLAGFFLVMAAIST